MTTQARIYTKDLARRVTLRLDPPLAEFISKQSQGAGSTPSEWVRMVLHSYMHAVAGAVGLATAISVPEETSGSSGKAPSNENKKANR